MNFREILGLLAAAVVLLLAAAIVDACQLWSFLGNCTVPWFCSVLAVGLAIVVLTSLLTGKPPATIPHIRAAMVVLVSSVVVGAGMLIDGLSYAPRPPNDWTGSLGEWVGFTLVLAVLFWIPRSGKGAVEQEDRDDTAQL